MVVVYFEKHLITSAIADLYDLQNVFIILEAQSRQLNEPSCDHRPVLSKFFM